MHPDASTIHQRAKEHGPATSALSHSQDVELVRDEPLVDSIEVQLGRYDLIIIEQEDELGFCGVDRSIATDTNADVVLFKVGDFAVLDGLGIPAREPVFRHSIVNDYNLGLAKLLSKRLDESVAGPRPMDGLDTEGNVLQTKPEA